MKHFIRALIFLSLSLPQISKAQNLQISGGNNFSAAVCDNQVVFVWGSNTEDQLGIINKAGTPYPGNYSSLPVSVSFGDTSMIAGITAIGKLPAIRQVDAGSGAFVMGLSCSKQVWAWGNNGKGQLGRNTIGDSPIPKRVLRGEQAQKFDPLHDDPNGLFLHDIDYVSGGNNCSFAIEAVTGRVLAWGENSFGQLGNGTITDSDEPVYVMTAPGVYLENIVQIEGGDACAFALDKTGKVWSWGITHDGTWPSYALGRPFTGERVAAPGGSSRCLPYAGKVQKTSINGTTLDNGACYNAVDLDGIKQLSGGDTHALGLATDGKVWSWGGDWGTGQLGQGNGGQYKACAGLVVDVNATYSQITPAQKALGEGADGAAVYVAAGQANSAVVLASGKVVTFGSNGLFEGKGTLETQAGTITCSGRISSGALGRGQCNGTTCAAAGDKDENDPAKAFEYPKYVLTGPGAEPGNHLTGITQISDGDAWFYAIGAGGKAYTWGWNRRGELGLGTPATPNNYTDQCYAVPFSLPSTCSFSEPCPPQPDLQSSYLTCPGFKDTLDSQVRPDVASWVYTWYSRPKSGGPWVKITGAAKDTLIVTKIATQYKVSLSDSRGNNVPFLCGACPILSDSLIIDTIPSPYKGTGCVDATHFQAGFTMTTPKTSKFVWYSKPAGGSPIPGGPKDTLSIGVLFNQTDTLSKINGCARGLWAEDTTSYKGNVRPTAPSCTGKQEYPGAGGRFPLQITVTKDTKINEISFIQYADGTNTHSYKIEIFNDASGAVGTTSKGSGTIGPIAASSNTKRSVTISNPVTLTPGKYWINVTGDGPILHFDCALTQNVSTPKPAVKITSALKDGGVSGNGAVFDIDFTVGTGYNCSRIWVCAENICVLPVQYIFFTGKKDNDIVELNWATAGEKDASHFEIERSTDGVNFEKIGSVSASGNSNRVIDYSFIDIHPLSGNAYYRLKQVDYNGQYEYSKIININSVKNSEVQVIPNPNNGTFNVVVLGAPKEAYEISVLNSLGQAIYSTTGKSESSNITQAVNIQNLASGVYYVRVITGESSTVKQIIKE